jgi:hypothetical protein
MDVSIDRTNAAALNPLLVVGTPLGSLGVADGTTVLYKHP